MIIEEYKGYTIESDPMYNPYSKHPYFMFYRTSEGINHDADCTDGESFTYCGNCQWAESLEEAKSVIDELTYEEPKSLNDIISDSIGGGYERGIKGGLMEAQLIMYQILNECKMQITPDELLLTFMERTQKLIKSNENATN
jgi:hypothetical protein